MTLSQGSEVKVTQSCPTLCNPMDCSLPGSLVHGILQAPPHAFSPAPFLGKGTALHLTEETRSSQGKGQAKGKTHFQTPAEQGSAEDQQSSIFITRKILWRMD
ncbi:unnamed protein product [Rangifer tarandus platyrhynchus]|uniref:Uncharacterized protein n=1 Tax=Rangifer tarandus platyrhynchus TaxID=3082113 RepID=A0ABN8Y4N0_RANTA|nr:unnamed protein product [Rangifer tarandus platyrhynchus]